MSDDALHFVANDNLPAMAVTYEDVDLTGYGAITLNIRYRPYALSIAGTVTDADEGEFSFAFASRAESTLQAATVAGATSLRVQVADYASFPASGELEIEGDAALLKERVRYSSKTAPDILNLTDALENAHAVDVGVEKLPDLRAGKYDADISVIDADGKVVTFDGMTFDVAREIA